MMFPLVENNHSHGTELAAMPKNFAASFESTRNVVVRAFHHPRGSVSIPTCGNRKYWDSSVALSLEFVDVEMPSSWCRDVLVLFMVCCEPFALPASALVVIAQVAPNLCVVN